MSAQKSTGSKKRRLDTPETGPFVLRSLLEDVPLSAEGENDGIEINCVEFLGEHSYCAAT
jgi:vacuolar protein sorting-associated protein 3